jgi:hypothetical protein
VRDFHVDFYSPVDLKKLDINLFRHAHFAAELQKKVMTFDKTPPDFINNQLN